MRRIISLVALHTPESIKARVHRNRSLDRLSRKIFSMAVKSTGAIVAIESGPMRGIRLAVSEHLSHAHIRGSYELGTQIAINKLLSHEFICYDVGASIGYISLLMARGAKHVFAFEPAPHAIAQLNNHMRANGFENITIVTSPISDCARPVQFSLTDNAYGCRIAETQQRKWPTITLMTSTLDDFVMSHPSPDLVKIDVEDEEARVLYGARSILCLRKALICCELHSEKSAREVKRILSNHRYRITKLDGQPFEISGPITPGDVQVLAVPE